MGGWVNRDREWWETLAVTSDGEVREWGGWVNRDREWWDTLAVTSDGEVREWGDMRGDRE
jgi:hypothetical protein